VLARLLQTRDSSSVSSGWKAEITATRGVASSRTESAASGVPGTAAASSSAAARGEARNAHRCLLAVDLGWLSSTLTVNLPSRMSFSLALTLATTSAGTFFSKVPSGASSEPLCFIIE
jgi:hypothetical protein